MASIRTKFIVGLFVIIGFSIAFFSIIWFGTSSHFEKGQLYVTYFDESVQGLGKDSPVKYRGMGIGKVHSIEIAPDAMLIQVLLKIDQGIQLNPNLIAQLKSIGITGLMFVELDIKSPGEPDLSPKTSFQVPYPVINSKPSDISRFLYNINAILVNFKALDLKNISDKINQSIDEISLLVKDTKLKEISSNARASLKTFNKALSAIDGASSSIQVLAEKTVGTVDSAADAVKKINNILSKNEEIISKTLSDVDGSLKTADELLKGGVDLVKNTDKTVSDIRHGLISTLQHIERTSEHLEQLTEQLTTHPSRLIFGTPPPEREIESSTNEP